MPSTEKIRLAVWKLTSCDGCQLQLLNLEDQLLALSDSVNFAYFPEGFRKPDRGRYDISLVEGSITTPHDRARLLHIRRKSSMVVAMGACATAGGIQALRNFNDIRQWMGLVYPRPEAIEALSHSTPIGDHIHVDLELRGCPVNATQLMAVILAGRDGRVPQLPTYSLCMECKRLGHICVSVAGGIPCMGPVTQAGCGALCPAVGRGCYGCFGPCDTANTAALRRIWLVRMGLTPERVQRAFQGINAWAEPFRHESEPL
jgi:coenzyme F420-reducing hydrogenase gamma subunit